MHIHISNLTRKTTANDIRNLFAGFGKIAVSKMIYVMDLHTRLPIGYAFVDIEDAAIGASAIEKLNGSIVAGNKIIVKKAK